MNTVGSKIKELRKNAGITQEELAEVLSVSYQAVSKWENSAASPDISLLPQIAGYFHITIDELLGYRLDTFTYKERFIKFMVEAGALKFGEFELKSGRRSPYFINTGNYDTGASLLKLGEFYAQCIRDCGLRADVLFGPAYKGIPLASSASIALFSRYGINISYCFDRKEEKDHGEGGQLVGRMPKPGDQILIVEDAMTSGRALREVLPKLRQIPDLKIEDMVISVDRMERGTQSGLSAVQEVKREFDIEVHSIVTVKDIIAAMEKDIIPGREYLKAMRIYLDKYGIQ